LNEVSAQLGEDTASSIALKDRLDRTSVRSPVNGTVNRLLINTVGGVVQPGMNLVEVVPTEGTLLVETKIKPSDIAFLRPAQQAKVKFTAYDFTIYGSLDAKLEQIGADSITDDKGNSYYLVQLRTDRNYLGPKSKPLPIISGMIATVDILTGKKTILSYLLKPVLRAKYMALRER
jgi:adhesin transport system membrane fusion protein